MRIVDVDSKVVEIRKIKVIVDSYVAILYGVETKRVNEAVKNNPDKFPKGYIITVSNTSLDKVSCLLPFRLIVLEPREFFRLEVVRSAFKSSSRYATASRLLSHP